MTKRIKQPTFMQTYMDGMDNLAIFLPNFYRVVADDEYRFSGLTIFIGDNNDYVVGCRRLNADGKTEVIWSSGQEAVLALLNLDAAIKVGKWRLGTDRPRKGHIDK